MESTPSDEIRVALPGSLAPITLPAGWSRASEPGGALTIVGPEGDLRVGFLICALDGTPEEIARGAWRVFDPGFDFHNVLTMEMSLTGTQFNKTAGVNQLVREAQRRVESLPGVTALASTCCLPLEGGFGLPFVIEGRPLTEGTAHGGASWRTVSPRYFEVFKIPLIRGRMFTDRDDANAPRVVLINEGLAKQFWPNSEPAGQRITIGKGWGRSSRSPRAKSSELWLMWGSGTGQPARSDHVHSRDPGERWSDGTQQRDHSHYMGDSHECGTVLTKQGN